MLYVVNRYILYFESNEAFQIDFFRHTIGRVGKSAIFNIFVLRGFELDPSYLDYLVYIVQLLYSLRIFHCF